MPGWLKGCAIGCGVMVLLTVVTFVGCGWSFIKPFQDAEETRVALEAEYGTQEDYVPPADGRVAPDRLEAFLAVQEDLQESCAELEDLFSYFERMDSMEEDGVSGTEKAGMILGAIGRGMRVPRALGHHHVERNESLAAHGMGLGEYTYIYVVGFYGVLGKAPGEQGEEGLKIDDGDHATFRVREALRRMLRAQLADLEAADGDPDLVRALRDEIGRLDDDLDRLPWQDGAPESIAASFAPYRTRLEEAWCPRADPFALNVARSGGGGISITTD